MPRYSAPTLFPIRILTWKDIRTGCARITKLPVSSRHPTPDDAARAGGRFRPARRRYRFESAGGARNLDNRPARSRRCPGVVGKNRAAKSPSRRRASGVQTDIVKALALGSQLRAQFAALMFTELARRRRAWRLPTINILRRNSRRDGPVRPVQPRRHRAPRALALKRVRPPRAKTRFV